MKIVLLCFLFLGVLTGAKELKKSGVLYLPDTIECRSGTGVNLDAEIAFRWDEDEPLYLGIFSNPKTGKNDMVLGSLTVFDENQHELETVIFVTLPPIPNGEVVVKKGELKRFGLYRLYSTIIFPRPGNYYAIANTDYGMTEQPEGKKTVTFTTSKRWFKVIEALPKKDGL